MKASATASSDPSQSAAAATTSLDQAITHLQTLKRKLSSLNTSSQDLARQSAARIQHMEELYQIPSLADVKYEEWSRIRLDRLLVDYLLRMGYTGSARQLAEEKGLEALVDLDEFEAVAKVERSLRVEKRVDAALAWCARNSTGLKKMNVSLFLMLWEL
jgi:macrophage erythroblast attacher